MFGPEWERAALLLIAVITPIFSGGAVAAYFKYRFEKNRPATLPPDALATIGVGVGNQLSNDKMQLTLERLMLVMDRLIDAINGFQDRIRRRRN